MSAQVLKKRDLRPTSVEMPESAPLSQVEKIRNKPEPSRFSAATQAAKKFVPETQEIPEE